jgi:predicted RecA/RadA family phage recombinase
MRMAISSELLCATFDTCATTESVAFVTAFTTAVPFFDGVTTFPAAEGEVGTPGSYAQEIQDWSEDLHTMLSPITIATFASGSITASTGLAEANATFTTNATLFDGANAAAQETAAITVINAYVAEVKALLNPSFDTFAEIDSAPKFVAAKTAYETAIASLYPTYIQFLNEGAAAIKAGTDGVYEVEKPMAANLDSKSLTFDLKITNYESAVSPAATLANSYVDSNGVKKEFLTFTKSVAGPGLLANQAFNTASTKVAIELDANGVNDTEQTEEATPAVYTRYRAAAHLADYSAVSNSVTINDIFALDVKFLTVNGLYTFTVNVGNIAKTIQVRVIDPKPVVNFTIDTDAGGNQFKLDSVSGNWIATLGASPTATSTDAPNAIFKLNVKNITLPSNGELAFTFTRKLPDLTDSNTNVVVATATADNDGVSTLAAITNLVIGGAGVEYTTKGTYVYELTVAGVKSTVTLVVQEFPTVTITDVKIGTASAVKFGGKFLLPDATAAFTIQGTAVNLSKATHYMLTTGTTAPNAGSAAPAAGRTTAEITAAGLVALNLANGIPVQFLTSGTATGLYATDAGLTDDALWVLVSLYERTNTTSFDPLNPLYDLTLIGFFSVPVWYEPTPAA